MSTTTLVWRTDIHLSDRAPKSRIDDWTETILGKIRQVGEIAREVHAQAVIDGGDFFHVKSPSRNSHRLVNQAAEAHKDYHCPVYANIGNHDCKYGDYDYLHEQPLGTLFESGVFKRLYDEHEAVFVAKEQHGFGYPIEILTGPDRCRVRVVGVPYHGTEYDMERLTSIKKGEEDYLIVAAHLLASPSGGSMFGSEDIVQYADLAGLDPDLWMFGHWHKNQGVTEIAPGKQVVNIGSLSRGALSQDDVGRIPSCAIIRCHANAGIVVEVRPLKVEPPKKVFDLDRRIKDESRDMNMEMFVDSIQETLEESKGESIEDVIRSLPDIPEAVREEALLQWEQA